jgi:hypothetical protein
MFSTTRRRTSHRLAPRRLATQRFLSKLEKYKCLDRWPNLGMESLQYRRSCIVQPYLCKKDVSLEMLARAGGLHASA